MLPVTASPPRRRSTAAPIAKALQPRSRSSARAVIRGALPPSPDQLYCNRSACARISHLASRTSKVRICISAPDSSRVFFVPDCRPLTKGTMVGACRNACKPTSFVLMGVSEKSGLSQQMPDPPKTVDGQPGHGFKEKREGCATNTPHPHRACPGRRIHLACGW
jgi:hypothetical protein